MKCRPVGMLQQNEEASCNVLEALFGASKVISKAELTYTSGLVEEIIRYFGSEFEITAHVRFNLVHARPLQRF